VSSAGLGSAAPVVSLLWHDLDTDPRSDRELDAILDATERARAERFAFPQLRRRYRVGRAVLRSLLGAWMDRPPARVAFALGPQGKPTLRSGPAFNVSHSGGQLLIGITPSGRLGVDVELLRPIDDLAATARHSFAVDEREGLLALPAAEQARGFLSIWTRKEALIKALGGGLSIPLQAFSVSRPNGAMAASGAGLASTLIRLELPGEHAADWCVASCAGAAGTLAAIALDVPACEVRRLALEELPQR